ncbi:hypothetical protein PVK06_026141 [Gossypium arboreum]|uniref:Uncharacterized protein n=1 Tax=Gossypium arboreum TaxID=29729 RepID=A0ABR0NY45_GOSAR|nr:hypothetical protein PVK06_026141 [Gossypium arboreum]
MTCKPSGEVRGENPPRDVTNTMTPIVAKKASSTTFTSVPHEFRTIPRCRKFVKTYGNGKSVKARIVDKYDSMIRYDAEHGYQPLCDNNIVNALDAV